MKCYYVEVPERHTAVYRIHAASPEEAYKLVRDLDISAELQSVEVNYTCPPSKGNAWLVDDEDGYECLCVTE